MRRRDFLYGLGAGLGTVVSGYVPMARASCSGHTNRYRVLEINLRGGLSAFDTVLWSERFYDPSRNITQGVAEIAEDVAVEASHLATPMGAISIGDPTQYLWASTDALGPLCSNPIFQDKWRVVCMQHDYFPHELAVPYTLAGTTQGREFHAGMGAWVKSCPVSGDPVEPSYVFYGAPMASTALIAARLQGLGGAASPVLVPWNGANANTALFNRSPQSRDGIVAALQGHYEDRLQYHAGVRSSAYQAYESSRTVLEDATTNVRDMIDLAPSTAPLEASVRTAIRMLQNQDARYICVIDSVEASGSPFDTHGHPDYAAHTQVWPYETHGGKHRRLLSEALAGLDELNGNDLQNIMVIVTTEFGRYRLGPGKDDIGGNSSHWTHGYAQLVIGGEVGANALTPAHTRLAGHIDDGGNALRSPGGAPGYTPGEFRAAMLYAAGIDVTVQDELDLGAAANAASLYNSIVKN